MSRQQKTLPADSSDRRLWPTESIAIGNDLILVQLTDLRIVRPS